MTIAALLTVMLMAAQVPVQTPSLDREAAAELAAARQLYASASYEEALERLDRVTASGTLADQVDTYRALCQLALGRTRDSERTVERILERNPRFVIDEIDTSPRLVVVFRSVRARLLPAAAKNLYAAARTSFDAKQYDNAEAKLRELLALLDADPTTESGVGDLRLLADLFLKQVEFVKASASAPPPAPVVTQPAGEVSSTGEPIYSLRDRDVIAPVEVSRPVPTMETPRGGKAGLYQGAVEIVINEVGRVEEVRIKSPMSPTFDSEIVAAAARWRFQPATKDGKPVKYRRSYEVIGHSR